MHVCVAHATPPGAEREREREIRVESIACDCTKSHYIQTLYTHTHTHTHKQKHKHKHTHTHTHTTAVPKGITLIPCTRCVLYIYISYIHYINCNLGGREQGARLLVKTRCKCQRKGRPQEQAEAQAPFPSLICNHGALGNPDPQTNKLSATPAT
jgi:hypothetical protein